MKHTQKLISELIKMAQAIADAPYQLTPDQWQCEAQGILRRAAQSEQAFEEWFFENENSEALRDDFSEYENQCGFSDETAMPFKDWCFERWTELQESPH